jgi:MFS family permease
MASPARPKRHRDASQQSSARHGPAERHDARSHGRVEPLLDLRLFRSLPFSSATGLAVLSFAAFSGFLFLNSLYLQEARGLHASDAGLMTLPIALALVVCSPLSGRLVGAGHARLALVVAGAAISCGALILTGLANDTPLPVLVAAYAIFGVGLGSIGAPVNTAAVSGMPRSEAGLAAAVASTSRQVGASLGVALAGSLAGDGIEAAHRADLTEATHPVFWIIVACGVVIVVLGVISTGARALASAERVASLLATREVASPAAATFTWNKVIDS